MPNRQPIPVRQQVLAERVDLCSFRGGCKFGVVLGTKPFDLDTPDGRFRVVWRWFPGKNTLTSFHLGCVTGVVLRAVMPLKVQIWLAHGKAE